MANEGLSEKIESTVVGVKDFAWRFTNTFAGVGSRPKHLVESLSDETAAKAFLRPDAFLLSCAIAWGFLSKINYTEIGFVEKLKDLTFWSFLLEIITTFAIAIVGAVVARLVIGRGVRVAGQIKAVTYYVIGFFTLGGFLILVLVLVATLGAEDLFGWRMQSLRTLAFTLLVAWVLYVSFLIQRMFAQALRADGTAPTRADQLRATVASVFVLLLCVLNLMLPFYLSEGTVPVRGSLVDLELQSDGGSVRLTYTLRNDANSRLVINKGEDPQVLFAGGPVGARVEHDKYFQGYFQKGCGFEPLKETFVMIDPGKAAVLTSCVTDRRFLELLREYGIAETSSREGGKMRLSPVEKNLLELSLKVDFVLEGRKPVSRQAKLGQVKLDN